MVPGFASPSLTKPIVQLLLHIRTLYLFTSSNFPTFALPTILFGLCAALSGQILTTNATPSLLQTLTRIPLALTLIWLNLLAFTISNQRTPTAVEEDKVNKPYRPIPSGRISCDQARQLLLVLTPMVGVAAYTSGVWTETGLLFVAQWMYNDLGGCEAHYLVRNLLSTVGYALFSSIALRILVGMEYGLNEKGV
ncbi:hypothetical protein NX059_000635 [Plenodomus lindquistii]|nr:hypothetical protein NX059_000635 [Plenodomus lindquistii]